MKSVVLALALTMCATAAVAQPWDAATSPRSFELAATDSYPVFPKELPAIRQGDGPVVHHTGAVKPNAVLATVPFVYRKPIRLTESMSFYVMRSKFAVEVKAGALGFVADPGSPRPNFVCIFTSDNFRSRTCYSRITLYDKNDSFFRKAFVTSPFPQVFPMQKDDGLVDAPVYEDAVIPADFALTVHFRKWSGDTAHLMWQYGDAGVYKMAVTPSEKGGPVRIVLPDGALVLRRDHANPKGALVAFEPATSQPSVPAQ